MITPAFLALLEAVLAAAAGDILIPAIELRSILLYNNCVKKR